MTSPLTETGLLGPNGPLVIAPLIGIGFGWFLERGGLSEAPKLAAQFYLSDLRVFKVMFSGLITAMLAAFWLDRIGWLDLGVVAMPETYLVPQAVGGVLFGAGFLLAGLCPGTSCVAAASGKLDGFGVIGGLLGGVALFDAFYHWIANFYESTPRGAITLADVTGVSRGVAVACITIVALAGFIAAEKIERRRA